MIITSPHNETLKQVRKLAAKRERARAGAFVAEGEDLLEAADAAGWEPRARLCVAGSGLPGTEVEAELLHAVSQLGSGTRTLAIYDQRYAPAATDGLTVHLHGVHDPGNVGTVLRAAHAFGAAAVSLGPGTADPYGPKAVRASMGAVFATPLVRAHGGVGDLPGATVALVARAGTALPRLGAQLADGPVTLLVGAERDGLPDDVVAACDHVAHIPIEGESLNAAMAAGVALYELRRIHMVTSDE
ncbi:TrmH family RNA methyltransferase [Paraconexibacter algicola]|uniref:TrmH family RNA methyltransferase n=1 Tax=Paraconexibacter algicola TaxID=2133960 RepID=UPI001304FDE7|nr:RNA methyltransferase [Paraconexibacter algicola]